MERPDRASMTTFLVDAIPAGSLDLSEEAAHHAQVKRLGLGDPIEVTDGRGLRGIGRIVAMDRKALRVEIEEIQEHARPAPIHLFVPVADKERMLWVAEKATELQIASWNPVMYQRSKSVLPRGEGESFDRKVHARMVGALEQSGGAWLPDVSPIRAVADIAGQPGVVLERGGEAFGKSPLTAPLRIAVGPEGGFTPAEVATLDEGGWMVASLGGVTLRFETAAVGAVAIARALLS